MRARRKTVDEKNLNNVTHMNDKRFCRGSRRNEKSRITVHVMKITNESNARG
jgi:hypothetical protein